MKKELKPATIAAVVAVTVIVAGGLYYTMLGPGSKPGMSHVASPYGLPTSAADFKKPLPTGSGRNSITGEVLPPRVMHHDPATTASLMQPPHAR